MFSSIHTENSRPATELAAGLTDLALEVLRKAGVDGDTVEMHAWYDVVLFTDPRQPAKVKPTSS